jgi:hypothetical protein
VRFFVPSLIDTQGWSVKSEVDRRDVKRLARLKL